MAEDMTYRMKGKVVLRHIGEDRLLVPVSGDAARDNCVFPLNASGEFIWGRLSVGRAVEAVAHDLAGTFDVSLEDARTDCQEYARQLVMQRLLEEVSP